MIKKNAPFFENLTKRLENYREIDPEIVVSFDYGAKVEIRGQSKRLYKVEFWEKENLVYSTSIGSGHFATPSKKYFAKWKVKVFSGEKLIREHEVELKDKHVHVFIDSSALGDSLAWMPQIERFREITGCKLILTTFHNGLFKEHYPNITWNEPGTALPLHEYKYTIGYHIDPEMYEKTPVDPRTIPLGQVPCEILGIPYVETRPRIKNNASNRDLSLGQYVCIGTTSTAGAKLWQRENGWQDLVDHIKDRGFNVVVIQKEETSLKGVIDKTGNFPLQERMNILEHCTLFVGLGSGLSWLAWAMEKPVVLISGFSDTFAEFQFDCERVINKNVCNSCWNDTNVSFDKGDWNWCPRNKDTARQFECTKQITVEQVIYHVDKILFRA